MKRFLMLIVVMLLILTVWGSALGQTGEEPKEKAVMKTPVMGDCYGGDQI